MIVTDLNVGKSVNAKEMRSVNYEPNDRYIVSFITGTEFKKDAPMPQTPEMAAALSLAMTRDARSDETIWFVFDRATEELHMFEQRDFEHFIDEHDLLR